MGDLALQAVGLTKAFGHVQALKGVNFGIGPGEVTAIVGDNGAGKSTFARILAGAESPDSGTILVGGIACRFSSPSDALNAGIAAVYQDLALIEPRDVVANVFLGREYGRGPFVDKSRNATEARAALARLGASMPSLSTSVSLLSGGQRQAVAIARAIARGGQIIIMDEPTAALGVKESARVLKIIRDVAEAARSVILISHNMQHVQEIADNVVVFHQGRIAGLRKADRMSSQELVELMMFGSLGAEPPSMGA